MIKTMKVWWLGILALTGAIFIAPVSAANRIVFDDSLNLMPLTPAGTVSTPLPLTEFKGKVVYLDFWASWCIPCKRSMPFLDTLYTQYKQRGFEILAVNMDENPSDAIAFLQHQEVTYPVVTEATQTLAQQAQLVGLPTGLLLDSDGKVLLKHEGFKSQDSQFLKAVIDKALAEHAFREF